MARSRWSENNKFYAVTMRSLRAGNDGAFRYEKDCNAPPAFLASAQLQQWGLRYATPYAKFRTVCDDVFPDIKSESGRSSTRIYM